VAIRESKIKLTFLVRSLDHGGTQRQLVTLAKALNKKQFEPTVIAFYSGYALEKELAAAGIPLISLRKRGRWDALGFSIRLIRELQRSRPDILHSYLDIPNLLALFARLFVSTRVVWGIRTSEIYLNHYDWLRCLSAKLERLGSRFADLIIVNSSAGYQRHIAMGFPAEKMVVIPNGVNTGEFRPDEVARQKQRSQWSIGNDRKLVGIIGRLDPMKDHDLFLQAASLVSRVRSDVRFVCVGGGPPQYAESLRANAAVSKLSDQVLWAGAMDNMPSAYNALDLLVSASVAEGFSNVIAEGMACGVPCVVTDVGDSAWLVGDTGIVVPPSDARALAEGLLTILDSDPRELGLRARTRIVENFNAQQLSERTELELLSLLRSSAEQVTSTAR